MAKKVNTNHNAEAPLYCLNAFSEKATSADFYIQTLREHLTEHEFVSNPHKHDFYLILFVAKGNGIHTIDFTDYAIRANTVFMMTPGQVHSWTLSEDADGFIIFFTKTFYQMQMSESNLMEFPFYHSLNASPVIKLEKDNVVDFIFKQMLAEYTVAEKPGGRLLRTYLDLLLLQLSKYAGNTDAKVLGSTFKLRRLEQLIEENFKILKQPSDYANLMNLSASYLNSICKDNLGKTLTDLIHERILLESKRLLAYSDLSVKEVAGRLNFADTSYFIRFFRKNTGLAPEEFKKSLSRDVSQQ